MWTSVGSAGTVDLADITKLIFEGPIVQLGRALITHGSQAAIVGSPVSATIRYGLHPDSFENQMNADQWVLGVSFRQGDGRIIAELVEADIETGTESDPLLIYDSAVPGFGSNNPSGFFLGVQRVARPHPLNVFGKAYYVKLTLSHNDVIIERTPPAVAALLLFTKQ